MQFGIAYMGGIVFRQDDDAIGAAGYGDSNGSVKHAFVVVYLSFCKCRYGDTCWRSHDKPDDSSTPYVADWAQSVATAMDDMKPKVLMFSESVITFVRMGSIRRFPRPFLQTMLLDSLSNEFSRPFWLGQWNKAVTGIERIVVRTHVVGHIVVS